MTPHEIGDTKAYILASFAAGEQIFTATCRSYKKGSINLVREGCQLWGNLIFHFLDRSSQFLTHIFALFVQRVSPFLETDV